MRDIWRVATLNIWNRSGVWEKRLPLIRDGLRALDADVIALQEVLAFGEQNQAKELAAGLGWNVYYGKAWELGGGVSMGNAIVSPHPIVDGQTLPLPSRPDVDQRSVAFARVDTPHGLLPVFATHLTFQLHMCDVRCEQVRALADHVAAVAAIDGLPPILAGDFNAEPDADEIRFLRGLTALGGRSVYFADCWIASGASGPGYSWDRRNDYAMRAHEPTRRIDYVFVRGPDRYLRGEPVAARLALDEPIDRVWPSDHFAVVADLTAVKRGHDPY